jgi:hypothetical protein
MNLCVYIRMSDTRYYTRTRQGGTIKRAVPKDGRLYFCAECHVYLVNHWYVHQCFPDESPRCYTCFQNRRTKCKRCGHKYNTILKTDNIQMFSF